MPSASAPSGPERGINPGGGPVLPERLRWLDCESMMPQCVYFMGPQILAAIPGTHQVLISNYFIFPPGADKPSLDEVQIAVMRVGSWDNPGVPARYIVDVRDIGPEHITYLSDVELAEVAETGKARPLAGLIYADENNRICYSGDPLLEQIARQMALEVDTAYSMRELEAKKPIIRIDLGQIA